MGEYENIFILNEPVIKVLGHKFNLVQDIEYADVCKISYKFMKIFKADLQLTYWIQGFDIICVKIS